MRIRGVSTELYRCGGRHVNCAGTDRQETHMDIIAIQIIATGALLVAHFVIVIRNRLFAGK